MGDNNNLVPGDQEPTKDVADIVIHGVQIEPELLEIFCEEAHSHLGVLERLCNACIQDKKGLFVGEEILLALHTLKGSAHTVNVPDIANLCELVENYAKKTRARDQVIPLKMMPLLKDVVKTIREILTALQDSQTSLSYNANLVSKIKALLEKSECISETESTGELSEASHFINQSTKERQTVLAAGHMNTGVDATVSYEQGKPDIPDEQDRELVEVYLEEASELLDDIDNSLQIWRQNPEDKNTVTELQRQLHTLKGGARMAGFSNIGDLSHALESLIVAIVEQRIKSSHEIFELLQRSLDALNLMQENARNAEPVYPNSDLLQDIQTIKSGKSIDSDSGRATAETYTAQAADPTLAKDGKEEEISDRQQNVNEYNDPRSLQTKNKHKSTKNKENLPSQELIRIRSTLVDRLVNNAGEVNIYHARLGQQITSFGFNLKELDQTVVRLRGQLRKLEMETEAQILFNYEMEQGENKEGFDPLELDRYSVMQQLSRALSESVSDLVSIQEILINVVKDAETLLLQQSRISTDLQEGLMRARMTQFSALGPRLRRIARQTAGELNKKVELIISGDDNELDRSVLDRMVAPLEHMLRNAISHGIEAPKQRDELGKPGQGKVYINVAREASEVVIKVKDDGAGIDIHAVRKKAQKQGLISKESNLPDYDIMQLILESGFSTAEEITQISGRGVGLDVVNSEIKELNGVLSINSIQGKGTTFIVRLPFTLAINQALLVQSGEDLYAVPLVSLEGIVRISSDELKEKYNQSSPVYEYAGNGYQLKHLGTMLGLSQPASFESHSILPILLVRSGEHRVALQVEGLLGSREVVVKSVGPQISKLRGISGATILGDGRVVLILDVPGLIRIGAGVNSDVSANQGSAQAINGSLPKVMVVDDSITIRKFTSRMLERNKFEAVTAKDGVDAIGKLQDYIPDLVLLDIEMPRMDGYELATHIRNTESLRNIPIIMITSRTGDKHRLRAIEIGVNRYLGKPYKEAELLENIRDILGLEDSGLHSASTG